MSSQDYNIFKDEEFYSEEYLEQKRQSEAELWSRLEAQPKATNENIEESESFNGFQLFYVTTAANEPKIESADFFSDQATSVRKRILDSLKDYKGELDIDNETEGESENTVEEPSSDEKRPKERFSRAMLYDED